MPTPPSSHAEVLVLGGGPAGRALAGECAARGLLTTLVDPAPDRPWRATYGAWADKLPATLPEAVVGARAVAHAFGTGPHRLARRYAVLDTRALRAHLDGRMTGVRVVAARAGGVRDDGGAHAVELAGRVLTADVVVDATGAPRGPGTQAAQTAYGIVVPAEVAAPLVSPGEALFMDWRPDHGHDGWPTFLYAVPYGDGTVLLEETSLAHRPGLGLPELRTRLYARLHRWDVHAADDAPVERVRFRVDAPRAPAHPVPFGAVTPLVHPASGFSVATALAMAPPVADALRDGLGSGGSRRAAAAARAVLWPPAAVAVHRLRRHGLHTVLGLPPELVPAFFEAFFRLRDDRAHAFLSGRDDLQGTLAAMAALFRQADPAVRGRLLRSALWPTATGRTTPLGDVRDTSATRGHYR